MSDGDVTVTALRFLTTARNDSKPVELTTMLPTFKGIDHLINQVINVEQLQFHAGVVYGVSEVVGHSVAECRNCRIVVRSAPLTKKIRETINQHLCSGFGSILQEQIFTCLFTATIFGIAEPSGEAGLLAAAEHYRATVAMFPERIQKGAGESEVALHEFFLVLRPIDSRKVEHEVGFLTGMIQFIRL